MISQSKGIKKLQHGCLFTGLHRTKVGGVMIMRGKKPNFAFMLSYSLFCLSVWRQYKDNISEHLSTKRSCLIMQLNLTETAIPWVLKHIRGSAGLSLGFCNPLICFSRFLVCYMDKTVDTRCSQSTPPSLPLSECQKAHLSAYQKTAIWSIQSNHDIMKSYLQRKTSLSRKFVELRL